MADINILTTNPSREDRLVYNTSIDHTYIDIDRDHYEIISNKSQLLIYIF